MSTIPTVKEILVPFLEALKDGKSYPSNEITEKIVKHFKLNDHQRTMRYESNTNSIFTTFLYDGAVPHS